MSKRVFFSYRRSHFIATQLLLAWVKESPGPFATFVDVDNIDKGESWAERIQSELVRSSGVIVVIDERWEPTKTKGDDSTNSSLDLSDWLSRELFIAHVLQLQILPVYLPRADPNKFHLPVELGFLRELQHVNIRSDETLRQQFEKEILPWIKRLPHSPYLGDAMDGVEMVKATLQNLHQSLKWLWQFLMGVALVNALHSVVTYVSKEGVAPEVLLPTALTLVSFLACFVRFYLGDSRYLDLTYIETTYQRGLEAEINKFSPTKRSIDIVLLLSLGGSFFVMSSFLSKLTEYLVAFEMLMVVNVFWLSVQLIWRQSRVGRYDSGMTNEASSLTGGMKPEDPLRIWAVNNAVFVVLVAAALALESPMIGVILTLANSAIDFYRTWPYYFPSLLKIRDGQVD